VPAARGLSRRFDADAALRRLEARIAARGREAAAPSSPAPRTPLAARERLFVAAAITISAMLAVILAFR
jgi:hypothetical protein